MHRRTTLNGDIVVVFPGESVTPDQVIAFCLEIGATVFDPMDVESGARYIVKLHPEQGAEILTDEQLRAAMDTPY